MFHQSKNNAASPKRPDWSEQSPKINLSPEKLKWLSCNNYYNWANTEALPILASAFGGEDFVTVNAKSGRTRDCHASLFSVLRGHLTASLSRGLTGPYRIHEFAAGRTFEQLFGYDPSIQRELLIGSPFPARFLAYQARKHGLEKSIIVEASDIQSANSSSIVCVSQTGKIYVGPRHSDMIDDSLLQALRANPQANIDLLQLYLFFENLKTEGVRSVHISPCSNAALEDEKFGLKYFSEVNCFKLEETLTPKSSGKYNFLYACCMSPGFKLEELKESIVPKLSTNGIVFIDVVPSKYYYLIRNWDDRRVSLTTIPKSIMLKFKFKFKFKFKIKIKIKIKI